MPIFRLKPLSSNIARVIIASGAPTAGWDLIIMPILHKAASRLCLFSLAGQFNFNPCGKFG
jgi:hypothetical protein